MSETQLLSDILNDSPCAELLRLRNREIIVLFLYETFYKHRELVAYDSLKMRLSDYLSSINLEKDEENDINVFDSYDEKAYKYIQKWTDKGFLRNYQEESGEVFYELSSYSSKVIDWLLSLKKDEFVGTESKFMNLYGQIKELVEFTNEDPDFHVSETLPVRQRNFFPISRKWKTISSPLQNPYIRNMPRETFRKVIFLDIRSMHLTSFNRVRREKVSMLFGISL